MGRIDVKLVTEDTMVRSEASLLARLLGKALRASYQVRNCGNVSDSEGCNKTSTKILKDMGQVPSKLK